MKKNLPVTDNEIPLSDDTVITSTTDLKGAITYVNQDFTKISGFSAEELLGKNHNIVRHPDIPPAAFADLWKDIKAGKSWMGYVKNRAKNGDYYWVDAFVMPVKRNGEIIAYESTRVKASDAAKAHASALYKKIWSGKKLRLKTLPLMTKFIIGAIGVPFALAAGLFAGGFLSLSVALLTWLTGAGLSAATVWYLLKDLPALLKEARGIVDNKIIQVAYTGNIDDISQISLSFKMLKAKLRTVVKRLEQATAQLGDIARDSAENVRTSNRSVEQQQQEIEMVATAVTEMSAAVQEVSQSTSNAATAASEASDMARQGALTVTDAIGIIDSLDTHVSQASTSIQQLKTDSENIGGVLDVIRGISEQTNLLALNAAIEAARAGEQGRGFAVVADEVRTLASRSHDATQEIQEMIEKLQQGVTNAVKGMDEVSKRAAEGVEQVEQAAEALAEISGSVSVINDMNTQISAATEEQSSVAAEISQNIEHINQLSMETARTAEQASAVSETMTEMTEQLRVMVEQFEES